MVTKLLQWLSFTQWALFEALFCHYSFSLLPALCEFCPLWSFVCITKCESAVPRMCLEIEGCLSAQACEHQEIQCYWNLTLPGIFSSAWLTNAFKHITLGRKKTWSLRINAWQVIELLQGLSNGAVVAVIHSGLSMSASTIQCLGIGACLRLSIFKDDEMQNRLA